MLFSAYQIESLLEDIQKENFPIDKSASEILRLSEDAIEEAKHYLQAPKKRNLTWVNPGDIMALVEDQTDYDPVVDYVQQSRAGRFVSPIYVPENPVPTFRLVSDHTKILRESEVSQEQNLEMDLPEEGTLLADKSLSIHSAEGIETDKSAEEVNQEPSHAETEISELDHISEEENENELAEESNEEQIVLEDDEESKKSSLASAEVSAASLFDEMDFEDDQDENFEIDAVGLNAGIDDESDVVFGEGRIEKKSMTKFVSHYPDSAIKFLLRKNLDGRPLPDGYDEIYINWENRGLSRGRLRKYLFKLMEWQDFPDIPVLDVVRKIRERNFELKEKNK